MSSKIEILLLSGKSIFTVDELSIFWKIYDRSRLWESIKYYLRTNKLFKLYSGVYTISKQYSQLELAVRLFPPAYISSYTALGIHGIVFQKYASVHVMALKSKTVHVQQMQFVFHKIKDSVFYNEMGIERKELYRLASPERAICDTLYLEPTTSFDYLGSVNWKTLKEMAKMYENKSLLNRVNTIARNFSDA